MKGEYQAVEFKNPTAKSISLELVRAAMYLGLSQEGNLKHLMVFLNVFCLMNFLMEVLAIYWSISGASFVLDIP